MVTAGDNHLRDTLTTSGNMAHTTVPGSGRPVPPPNVPASERSAEAQSEIDEEARRARENEVKRVQDGPPPWWGLDPAEVQGGTGAQGPGGYRFDPETIAAKITQWEQALDGIEKDGNHLQQAVSTLRSPSPDQPATEQTKATALSIGAAIEHNTKMQQYAQAYIDNLHKANGTYVQHDENVSGGLYGNASGAGTLDK